MSRPWRTGPGARVRSIGAGAAAVALVAVVLLAGCGDDGDAGDDAGGGTRGDGTEMPETTTTSVRTGGIEIEAPDGWQEIPLPQLGFGLAVPPGWEATVLSEDVLDALERSSPEVPGFLESARHAARTGAVFYAAGQDDAGRVADLKVRAVPEPGVDDVAGLERYAEDLVADAGDQVTDVSIEAVAGADRPTVRMRYQVAGRPGVGEDVAARGTEELTIGPRGVLWSVIVTSEDPATHERLAERIIGTLAFAPE